MATDQEKIAAITAMQSAYWDAQQLELTLRFKAKTAEAEDVWAKNQRLGTEIDILIGEAIDQWANDAATVATNIKAATDDLEKRVQQIKADIDLAQNIVEAVGLIDD